MTGIRPGLLVMVAVAAVWGPAGTAGAVTAVQTCEAAKLKALGKAQACLANEQATAVKGGVADLTKCTAQFADALAAADKKAAKKGASCRFIDNSDGTITDLNTAFMWEQKVAGSGCLHCVNDLYTWFDGMSEFISQVNGTGLAGHSDWRLPNIAELQTILLAHFPSCPISPCIDPIFTPTAASRYWSSSTFAGAPAAAWVVFFGNGGVFANFKTDTNFVRAVRGGL